MDIEGNPCKIRAMIFSKPTISNPNLDLDNRLDDKISV